MRTVSAEPSHRKLHAFVRIGHEPYLELDFESGVRAAAVMLAWRCNDALKIEIQGGYVTASRTWHFSSSGVTWAMLLPNCYQFDAFKGAFADGCRPSTLIMGSTELVPDQKNENIFSSHWPALSADHMPAAARATFVASSAESVGEFRLRQVPKLVIQSEVESAGTENVETAGERQAGTAITTGR